MANEQELLIPSVQRSSVFSTWKLELDTIEEGVYGYGYGKDFYIVEKGFGDLLFDIGTGLPVGDEISGTIQMGMGWEATHPVLVTDFVNDETFVGQVKTYNSTTGDIVVVVPSSPILISPPETNAGSIESLNLPSLDYFNVLGLPGNLLGYGYKSSESPFEVTNFEPSYSYGWGYEYGNFIFADNMDSVVVRARVLKDDIPQSGVRVFFWGSVGVLLSPSVATTDIDGYAETIVRMTKDLSINQIDGWGYEYFLEREVPQVFRSINGAGGRTVSAMIYEAPEHDDGNLTMETSSEQKFFSQVVFNLDFDSYAFNEGEDIV